MSPQGPEEILRLSDFDLTFAVRGQYNRICSFGAGGTKPNWHREVRSGLCRLFCLKPLEVLISLDFCASCATNINASLLVQGQALKGERQ
jgi:hypothetical protein